jgi:hypothetical protein
MAEQFGMTGLRFNSKFTLKNCHCNMNASKNLGILIQKIVSDLPDPDLDFFTHPGSGSRVKKAPDPGSGSATLITIM